MLFRNIASRPKVHFIRRLAAKRRMRKVTMVLVHVEGDQILNGADREIGLSTRTLKSRRGHRC